MYIHTHTCQPQEFKTLDNLPKCLDFTKFPWAKVSNQPKIMMQNVRMEDES